MFTKVLSHPIQKVCLKTALLDFGFLCSQQTQVKSHQEQTLCHLGRFREE